jgi:FtsP/CotA-like multicopper oxidase with cupredoxin domain
MTPRFSRRGFIAASAALAASTTLPRMAFGQDGPMALVAGTRVLDIDGRAAKVFGLTNAAGGQGIILDPGQRFRVDLTNTLAEETIIHWHGQLPPNVQDGVPNIPMALLQPGETRSYDYAATTGTHWMHSHLPLQEMNLLAAPLIVRSADDMVADRQEVVMFLHDFSFRSPAEVLEEITSGAMPHNMAEMDEAPKEEPDAMAGMDHSGMNMSGDAAMDTMTEEKPDTMASMDHSGMNMSVETAMGTMKMDGTDMGNMAGMEMDLNDFNFDAYLANDRTLNDPDVIRVDRRTRVRLRIINAAAATSFWIDTGGLAARLVAVDGHEIEPMLGTRFGMAMAQRLDIEVDITAEGAFPIFALREGARERTGIILATPSAIVEKISGIADQASPAFDTDMGQEWMLRSATARSLASLADRPVDRRHMIMLGGDMQPYVWTINGKTWGDHTPITAISGERVELTFHNMSMMGHPMHLHGHVFQVVNINGQALKGAMRDTVYVPPMAQVTVALDAGEAARWMLHCHHMPHLSTGMMTEFAVSAA